MINYDDDDDDDDDDEAGHDDPEARNHSTQDREDQKGREGHDGDDDAAAAAAAYECLAHDRVYTRTPGVGGLHRNRGKSQGHNQDLDQGQESRGHDRMEAVGCLPDREDRRRISQMLLDWARTDRDHGEGHEGQQMRRVEGRGGGRDGREGRKGCGDRGRGRAWLQ